MSDEPAHNPKAIRNSKESHTIHSSKPGGSRKTGLLLAGAAALALLIGGGYYVWSNGSPTQVASNDYTESFPAPSAYNEAGGNAATIEKSADPVATTEAQPLAKSPAQQKTRVAAAEVPEETIGVSNVSSTTTQSDEVIVNSTRRPVWRYTPRADRLAEYYPASALERGREGEASLHCIVGKKGALDCERVSETPARAGFGSAAMQVARTLRHADTRADGKNALGTPVNLRVVFRMAEGERRG